MNSSIRIGQSLTVGGVVVDNRSKFSIKIDALKRLFMTQMLSGVLPLYIVTEYPKSGGTWLGQMLGYYFGVPFPRNQPPKIESCIMHGHYLHTPFLKNVFCLVRDGRDVMVSAYYYMLFENDKNSPHLVHKTRKLNAFANYDDIERNMPRFIEYLFTVENKGLFHFNWNEFIDSWYGRPGAVFIKYEDLLSGAAAALKEPIQRITHASYVNMQRLHEAQEKFSFATMKKKESEGGGRSFLRKGIAGDWKNVFTREAREVFDHYAGQNLVRLGYENDRSWIAQQPVKAQN